MTETEKFLRLFKQDERTETIKKLASKQLEERMWIADGMYLSSTRHDNLQYFILDQEKCKQYERLFLIFAKATHSGSSYAFYKKEGAENGDEWPIVVMGDEGGVVAIAENIFELMRFWTLNSVQAYVGSDYRSFDLFTDDEMDTNPESSNQAYKNWIKQEFGLEAISSIAQAEEEIINPAIKKYQHILDPIFEVND